MYAIIAVYYRMMFLKKGWENVMSKENKIKPLPTPIPQVCPKCGNIYNENKWGGCGICSCGYYFHPEWYGKGNKKMQEEGTEGQDRESYTDTQDRNSYIPDPNLTEEELIEKARKYGKIK